MADKNKSQSKRLPSDVIGVKTRDSLKPDVILRNGFEVLFSAGETEDIIQFSENASLRTVEAAQQAMSMLSRIAGEIFQRLCVSFPLRDFKVGTPITKELFTRLVGHTKRLVDGQNQADILHHFLKHLDTMFQVMRQDHINGKDADELEANYWSEKVAKSKNSGAAPSETDSLKTEVMDEAEGDVTDDDMPGLMLWESPQRPLIGSPRAKSPKQVVFKDAMSDRDSSPEHEHEELADDEVVWVPPPEYAMSDRDSSPEREHEELADDEVVWVPPPEFSSSSSAFRGSAFRGSSASAKRKRERTSVGDNFVRVIKPDHGVARNQEVHQDYQGPKGHKK